jgi:hypothetical protein
MNQLRQRVKEIGKESMIARIDEKYFKVADKSFWNTRMWKHIAIQGAIVFGYSHARARFSGTPLSALQNSMLLSYVLVNAWITNKTLPHVNQSLNTKLLETRGQLVPKKLDLFFGAIDTPATHKMAQTMYDATLQGLPFFICYAYVRYLFFASLVSDMLIEFVLN